MNNNALTKLQNEFLGGKAAIIIENQHQFEELKEFMSVRNLFQRDGSPISRLNIVINEPTAFFRNYTQSYVDYGTILDAERDNYQILTYNEVFAEQMNFFGTDGVITQPKEELIKQEGEKNMENNENVLEQENKVVENQLSLVEIINTLEVESVVPASIKENITQNKDILIEAVNQYKDIVVTKDNYTELASTRADLNKKKDYLVEQRKRVKKEAAKDIDLFLNSIGEVIKAVEGVVDPLNADIKKYEAEAKEELKTQILERDIKPLLDAAISENYFTQEIANKFVFDDSWTNATSITKTGALTAKTKEAINTELNRLITLFNQQEADIKMIESSVKQLAIARNVEGSFKVDTYVELYKNGVSMPDVQERINQDLEMIKKTVDVAVQKNTENIQSQQQSAQPEQVTENIGDVSEMPSQGIISDDKTGEVLGKFNGKQILTDMAVAPANYEEKEYEYTYKFSGPCAIIMTLNKILKLLSKINPKFNYEKVGK